MTKAKQRVLLPSYRAFNLQTKEMVWFFEGLPVDVQVKFQADGVWHFYEIKGPTKVRCLVNSDCGILMRGSGYYDINGEEIFEGDVIKNLSTTTSLSDGDHFLYAEVLLEDNQLVDSYFHQGLEFYNNAEIAGNRYENMDLLGLSGIRR